MTNMEILYSFAKYIYDNNPTTIQIGYEGKNLENGATISETEEYININEGNGQNIIDRIGSSYVLKDFEVVAYLKYNKTGLFDSREILFQRFIEGIDTTLNESFYFMEYNTVTSNFVQSNRKLYIDYTKVESPVTAYSDDNTKSIFWVLKLTHSN